MASKIAVVPPVPGSAGPALVNIGNDSYLTYLDANGQSTGNVAARLENLGSDEAPALRLIITNDPAPEFKRENGRIEVAVP